MSFGCIAGDVADLHEPGKVMIIGSARVVAPCCLAGFLWPPTARSTGEFFRLPDPSASGALLGFLVLALRRQNFLPSPGCRTALALCPRLAASALFRRSGRYGRRNLAQAQRTCWFKPTGQGARLPVLVVFRQHRCRLSSAVNWFRLGAFFLLARPT